MFIVTEYIKNLHTICALAFFFPFFALFLFCARSYRELWPNAFYVIIEENIENGKYMTIDMCACVCVCVPMSVPSVINMVEHVRVQRLLNVDYFEMDFFLLKILYSKS